MAHKVRKLVHHHVFDAFDGLIDQIQVEIEGTFLEAATSKKERSISIYT